MTAETAHLMGENLCPNKNIKNASVTGVDGDVTALSSTGARLSEELLV